MLQSWSCCMRRQLVFKCPVIKALFSLLGGLETVLKGLILHDEISSDTMN